MDVLAVTALRKEEVGIRVLLVKFCNGDSRRKSQSFALDLEVFTVPSSVWYSD
jgi:hypothetical protein